MHWWVLHTTRRTFLVADFLLVAAAVDTTPEQATKVFDTNVVAALRMARTVLPHMAARRSGTIVNIGSVAGEMCVQF
jgi:NADP-dependent 3-hydroxy acid dehydrogenase YdfG